MPIHDWTRIDAGTFHAFHTLWISETMKALNAGLLPKGYYALAEQIAGRMQTDVLTLSSVKTRQTPDNPPAEGSVAVADAPPAVSLSLVPDSKPRPRATTRRGRHIAVRHVSGHRIVALIEIVSPSNKDRRSSVEDFTDKVVHSLREGIHVLLIDLLPPTRHDRHGMHGSVWSSFNSRPYQSRMDRPLTLASYAWQGKLPKVYVEPVAVGQSLIDMPLFLTPERYINVPLEPTYQAAYAGMPEIWRDVLEGRTPPPESA